MQKLIVLIFFIGLHLLPLGAGSQETIRYHLTVKDTLVNFTGKNKRAIAVNGTIPKPAHHFIMPT
ncbi:MAG: hypothetical protein ACI9YL_000706 [Luteibaculaceae bacterium]|jgi:hypothetical protein